MKAFFKLIFNKIAGGIKYITSNTTLLLSSIIGILFGLLKLQKNKENKLKEKIKEKDRTIDTIDHINKQNIEANKIDTEYQKIKYNYENKMKDVNKETEDIDEERNKIKEELKNKDKMELSKWGE
jgi:hypothetical protein